MMMTAIWNPRQAFGPGKGGGGGGSGGGSGGNGGGGKKNKPPVVPDVTMAFEKIGAAANTAPTGQSQDMTFVVAAG